MRGYDTEFSFRLQFLGLKMYALTLRPTTSMYTDTVANKRRFLSYHMVSHVSPDSQPIYYVRLV